MSDLIKIMMVEDDKNVCVAYQLAIEKFDHMRLVYATDSEKRALDYLEQNEVDVLILDLELREGDGISFLMKAKKRLEQLPYIMVVTNTASSLMLGLVRENGADFVYQKTNALYNEEKVLSLIDKAVPYKDQNTQRKMELAIAREEELLHMREIKRYIYHALLAIGFKAGVLGTAYLQDIIYVALKDRMEVDDARVKELYEETAKMNNT